MVDQPSVKLGKNLVFLSVGCETSEISMLYF